MPVFAAAIATFITIPAEKSLALHVQFLRELLGRLVSRVLIWFDSRDVCADGFTKGIVDRAAIQEVTNGTMAIRHDTTNWTGRKNGGACPEVLHTAQLTDLVYLQIFCGHLLPQAIASSQQQKCFTAMAHQKSSNDRR